MRTLIALAALAPSLAFGQYYGGTPAQNFALGAAQAAQQVIQGQYAYPQAQYDFQAQNYNLQQRALMAAQAETLRAQADAIRAQEFRRSMESVGINTDINSGRGRSR